MAASITVSQSVLSWIIKQVQNSAIPSPCLPILNSWQNGKTPTLHQIEAVSKKTHIPLGYFFLQNPPQEDVPLLQYRTVANAEFNNPSRELIDTIDNMEQIVDWTRNYMLGENSEKNSIVGMCKNESNFMKIASSIRTILGLTETWFDGASNVRESFNKLRGRISESGVIVMLNGVVKNNTHRPLELNEFRAFAMIDEYAPLIFINGADSPNGRLFSLLHEFTHICLGISSLYNVSFYGNYKADGKIEQICNAVSAEILVPSGIFNDKYQYYKELTNSSNEISKKLSSYFKCGSVVVARKALDFGLITKDEYKQISDDAIAKFREEKNIKTSGGNYYSTMETRLDSRFFSLVVDSVSQGKTQYSEAFALTNTNRNTFVKLAEAM